MTTPELSSRRADTVEAAEVVTANERAELAEYRRRAELNPLSGMSWGGFNVWGDDKSMTEVKAAVHSHGQIEEFRTLLRHQREELGKLHANVRTSAATIASLASQVEGLKVERDEALRRSDANADQARLANANFKAMVAARDYVLTEYHEAIARTEKAEAALASQAIPESFMLAPKEPTEEMLAAGEPFVANVTRRNGRDLVDPAPLPRHARRYPRRSRGKTNDRQTK